MGSVRATVSPSYGSPAFSLRTFTDWPNVAPVQLDNLAHTIAELSSNKVDRLTALCWHVSLVVKMQADVPAVAQLFLENRFFIDGVWLVSQVNHEVKILAPWLVSINLRHRCWSM